jgi:DNA modification methylase/superfamily II DNA or RNA helicase
MDYEEFIASKRYEWAACGFDAVDMNDSLYPFQRDIVKWACKKGKAAIFADCGMGKTPMQLEWARQIVDHTSGMVLILAPLAVAAQTEREGAKFGIAVNRCRTQDDLKPGINITNYEMLQHFDDAEFSGVVLDESSILKSYSGSMRNAIIDRFQSTPYRLACTATPAPNDFMELGNHSEFLGVMARTEMLAMFFVHDGGSTSEWRLKGHAVEKYWDWVSNWACMITKPSDLGYDDEGFELPELNIETDTIESGMDPGERLFNVSDLTLLEQQRARRSTVEVKGDFIADIVNQSDEPWLIWCDLNAESDYLANSISDSVEVKGSDTIESKEDAMIGFSTGKYRVLVTKPSIAGFGMNWQHCHHVAFCGLSHSYEQFYQAVRRCYRYGQTCPVDVHIVVTEKEQAIVSNVTRKKEASNEMKEQMVKRSANINGDIDATARDSADYAESDIHGDGWDMLLGDCVERLKTFDDETFDFSVFSPPFASLYTYSNSDRDMGNCKTESEFMEHFGFMLRELYRVMKPGRLVSFHCMNIQTSKTRDGYIGISDFRGDLIRAFQDVGFIYASEVTIWKDPVTAMQRTKALGLLNKQKNKDSSMSRQGIPDYLVTMRKPGENQSPISHTNAEFPIAVWQKYASPVWMDINPSKTLQYLAARENGDERHICPLQLDVIERAIKLWTNPGDLVLSPFAGIGSEGYVSIKDGRRFVGIELKKSYFDLACKNLDEAVREAHGLTLFDVRQVI